MPIGAIPPIPPLTPLQPATGPASAGPVAGAGSSFGAAIAQAVDGLQQTQAGAAKSEAQSAAGEGNLADTMIAASKASVETEIATSLLDKAVTSYNDIMNMSF